MSKIDRKPLIENHARACSSYECFILRAARLSSKHLGQGYVMERLKSSLRTFYGRYGGLIKTLWSIPLPNVTWHSGTWPYTMTPSIDKTLHQFINLLPNWTLLPILTLLPNFDGFHRTLQRVRLANRVGLLPRTLVLSHLGPAFVLMLRPFFLELVMSIDLLSFEHPSVLLFCLSIKYCNRRNRILPIPSLRSERQSQQNMKRRVTL